MYGLNHIRYEHCSRPVLLHLSCPKCARRCVAKKPSENHNKLYAGDCTKAWGTDDWEVRCESCLYRKSGLSYDALPSLYYKVCTSGGELWAWNKDHLITLKRFLNHENVKDEPYEWFLTYAKKEWVLKRNRRRFVKAIEKFISGSE